MKLLAPYFALGFDQMMIQSPKSPKYVKMGELRSLSHLCKYGRPLCVALAHILHNSSPYTRWHALFSQATKDIIALARSKLINDDHAFDPTNEDHVLAVLSARLCIDLVLAPSEVSQLADQSVANHMRLLTGISPKPIAFYTNSPSEPILALAATRALFASDDNLKDHWATSLDTFTRKLCSSGAVEKGLLGELAARTLLLVTRDFAAQTKDEYEGPDMLEPVSFLLFFNTLFGTEEWACPDQKSFNDSFRDTHLNFTHWIITKDSLPEQADP